MFGRIGRPVVAWVATMIASAAGAQNLLTNGDFELAVPSEGSGNGWTAGNNDWLGGWSSGGGHPDGCFVLNWNGSSTDPFIFQDVTGLAPGTRYVVQVDYRTQYFSGTGVRDFGIEVDGNLWEFDILDDDVWRTPQVSFVATQSAVRLQFTGERIGDAAPCIDNASLAPVPEPASILAFTIGLGGLAFRRFSRR